MTDSKGSFCPRLRMNKKMEMLMKVKIVNELAARNHTCAHHVDHFAEFRQKAKPLRHYLSTSSDKSAALLAAVEDRRADLVESLLLEGVPANSADVFGTTGLHLAGSLGDAEIAGLLLASGADPDARDLLGATPLLAALKNGSVGLVDKLIKSGCELDCVLLVGKLQFATYLHCAVEMNSIEIVELLLKHKAEVNRSDCTGRTALHLACKLGLPRMVELLLRHGADVRQKDENERSAVYAAVEAGQLEVSKLLLERGADPAERGPGGMSLLQVAMRRADAELGRLLLERRVDVNAATSFGRTALHWAIDEQFWPGLRLLLEHGADVNRAEQHGRTSLYRLVELRRRELVELAIEHGAEVNASDRLEGETVLHLAVKRGWPDMTRLLLERGANVDARDRHLRTPLHLAVNLGQLQVLQLLNAADVNAADESGNTPLHLAIDRLFCYSRPEPEHYHRALLEQLLSRGADVNRKIESSGKTPLHLAVKNKCGQIVWDLLCRGAAPDAKAILEETPLRMAVANQDAECIENLLIFGASIGRLDPDDAPPILVRAFARYAVKLQAAGFKANNLLGAKLLGEPSMNELRQRCREEVQRMRLTPLSEGLTYYKFLHGNKRQLTVLVARPEVQRVFERRLQRPEFPLYANMLERNFVMGKCCKSVLKEATSALNAIFDYRIPSVPLDCVLDFLVERDMYNVIEATRLMASTEQCPCD